jgi:membrane carboxypeptidase/penicillin-binding protein PbpC
MLLLSRLICIVAKQLMWREWEELCTRIERLKKYSSGNPAVAPAWIAQALLISGEDHRFFRHGGIDVFAVCRAIWRRLFMGRREGASTIEMQLVRVLTRRFELTLARKVREAGLATLLTSIVSKSEIPGLYLRVAYYGTKMTGYSSACAQLGLDPSRMSPRQAAALVARLKYPEPAAPSERVGKLIRVRTAHLLRLYTEHLNSQAYIGLPGRSEYATI